MGHRSPGILVFDGKDRLADFLVGEWREISRRAVGKKGFFAVALSGGETPLPFYRKLAAERETLPWSQTHIFLADERWVSFRSRDSNYGMLKKTFLTQGPIPSANIHPVPVGEETPQKSARKYEEEIRAFFRVPSPGVPVFDLILLGMGEDGHTASLFPESRVLKDESHLASEVMLEEGKPPRITLTFRVINRAERVFFLVTGRKKAEAVERVIRKGDPSLPASGVKPHSGDLLFLLDSEASSLL